jgi:glycosyltransferase involved in cell wall biosynthesis
VVNRAFDAWRGHRRSYLFVIDSLQCGGAERHVIDLGRVLTDRGHSVTVACSVGGHFQSAGDQAGMKVVPVCRELAKRRFSATFARGVRRLVREEQPDLVHGHLYSGGLAAAVATAGTGIPLLLTEQTEAPWRTRRHRLASSIAYRRAAKIIGVSSAITAAIERDFGVAPEKLACIPNGVTLEQGTASRPNGEPVIGVVARLTPEKDVRCFLNAAARIAESFPTAKFRIAGDGPLRPELERLAAELGLAERVSFLGVLDEMQPFFASVHVLAVSSVAEGTPLSIVEAMGAGVPIVATAVGGIPEQVTDGRNGYLVEPRNPAALAERIGWVLADPDAATRLGEAGRARALSEFTVEKMSDAIESVYADALTRRRAARPAAAPALEARPAERV